MQNAFKKLISDHDLSPLAWAAVSVGLYAVAVLIQAAIG